MTLSRRLAAEFVGTALLLVCALPALAQVPPFGAPFPLANTRYGAANGMPLLRTDGKATFLFWGQTPCT